MNDTEYLYYFTKTLSDDAPHKPGGVWRSAQRLSVFSTIVHNNWRYRVVPVYPQAGKYYHQVYAGYLEAIGPVEAPTTPGNEVEENELLIDERQVEVLDGFRNARDVAKRHAQSKVDRATLMKIQAEALIAEARELVAELNEDTPMPNEEGADIGPLRGAGGARR